MFGLCFVVELVVSFLVCAIIPMSMKDLTPGCLTLIWFGVVCVCVLLSSSQCYGFVYMLDCGISWSCFHVVSISVVNKKANSVERVETSN